MTTELEQTQLELARTQLAQEQLKLQKMQRRHEAKQALGQGAMAVGGAAAGGVSAVLRYIGRWLVLALGTEVMIWGVLAFFVWKVGAPNGFWFDLGAELKYSEWANIVAVLLNASVWAFAPLALFRKDGQVVLLIIPAAVLAVRYFLL